MSSVYPIFALQNYENPQEATLKHPFFQMIYLRNHMYNPCTFSNKFEHTISHARNSEII